MQHFFVFFATGIIFSIFQIFDILKFGKKSGGGKVRARSREVEPPADLRRNHALPKNIPDRLGSRSHHIPGGRGHYSIYLSGMYGVSNNPGN